MGGGGTEYCGGGKIRTRGFLLDGEVHARLLHLGDFLEQLLRGLRQHAVLGGLLRLLGRRGVDALGRARRLGRRLERRRGRRARKELRKRICGLLLCRLELAAARSCRRAHRARRGDARLRRALVDNGGELRKDVDVVVVVAAAAASAAPAAAAALRLLDLARVLLARRALGRLALALAVERVAAAERPVVVLFVLRVGRGGVGWGRGWAFGVG